MFESLKKSIRNLFFPYNNFTIEILTILRCSTSHLTLAGIHHEFLGDPAIARLKLTMDRLEAKGYVIANKSLLYNPPKTVYQITDTGRRILEERNFS